MPPDRTDDEPCRGYIPLLIIRSIGVAPGGGVPPPVAHVLRAALGVVGRGREIRVSDTAGPSLGGVEQPLQKRPAPAAARPGAVASASCPTRRGRSRRMKFSTFRRVT